MIACIKKDNPLSLRCRAILVLKKVHNPIYIILLLEVEIPAVLLKSSLYFLSTENSFC